MRAPIGGKISRKLVTEGNLVNANQTVLTNIVSIDPIQFYFDVDERSFIAYADRTGIASRPRRRTTASAVRVAVDRRSEPKRPGRMDFIDNRLEATSGTIRVRAVFANKDLFLTPGMFGRIRIMGSGKYKGVLVPDEAIASDQDRRVVYVVGPDDVVSTKTVRLGPKQ